jgi:DNA-binding transcriptional MocR family regulator
MQELQEYHSKLQQKYNEFKDMKLKLDMSRGKPCSQQLDLSNGLLDCLEENDYRTADGTDCRNYGGIEGIAEARELFAQMLEVSPSEIIISSNASLNVMYDSIVRAMMFGVAGSETPWGKLPKVKFLCPSPGYDRHFAICELLNIEMIVVDMKSDGPDMDMVERLAGKDEAIKGIWCVPKYSNPQGITYSDEVVDRLARMRTKASDFRIFWDNAYVIHHLYDEHDSLKNIMTACKEAGNPDRVFIFGSTSKISFAGAGIAMMAASENNIGLIRKQMGIQTICPDKLNQLRHVRFFKSFDNIMTHMEKHSAILRPKFETVLDILERELGGKGIADWNNPHGGYFISLDTMEGCAKAVVAMAGEAGVTLTKAGATFPYGKDPLDRNIRIAPSYPPIDELRTAIELLCVCVQLVSAEKLIREKTCKA